MCTAKKLKKTKNNYKFYQLVNYKLIYKMKNLKKLITLPQIFYINREREK